MVSQKWMGRLKRLRGESAAQIVTVCTVNVNITHSENWSEERGHSRLPNSLGKVADLGLRSSAAAQ